LPSMHQLDAKRQSVALSGDHSDATSRL
jgi:hypothetical protein